jgi:glycosyltransferase involved in cell wall biosynthesis
MTVVSICIPTHSAKRLGYLREALASVRAQTHTETEILLWDNSHDEPLRAFAEEQMREDPRIRYKRHEPSVSAGANFDSALQASRGEYVVMLGDDDRLLPQAVEMLLAAKEPDSVVTFPNLHIIDSHGQRQPTMTHEHLTTFGRDRLPSGRVADPIACAWRNSVFLPGSLMRSAELKRYGLNSTIRGGDFLVMTQLARDGHSFLHLEDYLFEYRVHPGSVTAGGSTKENEGLFALLEPIQVPPHVEPLKRRMLGGILMATVSESLRVGDVERARALIREPYYPALRDEPAYVIAQRLLATLPSKIARSSALAASTARRQTRAIARWVRTG